MKHLTVPQIDRKTERTLIVLTLLSGAAGLVAEYVPRVSLAMCIAILLALAVAFVRSEWCGYSAWPPRGGGTPSADFSDSFADDSHLAEVAHTDEAR